MLCLRSAQLPRGSGCAKASVASRNAAAPAGKLPPSLSGRGRATWVRVGDIRCDPDDSESDSIWVRFDNDKHPLRQVSSGWLVREDDYRQGELG
jgi:hypothetical protein